MPNFDEDNSYDPLFVKPKDPSPSERVERLTANMNGLKNDLKKANDLLKNGKLSAQARLKLETATAIYTIKLKKFEEEFRNITMQSHRMQ